MIEDLNALPEASQWSCDVCIVGSGAVGMAVARDLISSPLRVVVVESGGATDEPATQALYDSEILGLPFPGAVTGRFRTLGGSTTRWGGQALPLDPVDFDVRPWVTGSGWPFGLEAVAPYYPRAADFLGLDPWNFTTDLFERLRAPAPAVDDEALSYHFSKWAPEPNLRRTYLSLLASAATLRLLTHANVTRIDLDRSLSRVERVTLRSLGGRTATVSPRRLVICTGGIETARLLLLNDHQVAGGLGNGHDLVGRYFQDHPSAVVGRIDAADPSRLQRWFNLFYRGGRKYAVRLSASETFQRRHQTVNLSSGIRFDLEQDSPIARLKTIYPSLRGGRIDTDALRTLLACVGHIPSLLGPAYAYLIRRRQYTPTAVLRLGIISEQEPNPLSRITLSGDRDALGLRKSAIDWRLTEITGRSVRLFARTLRDQFAHWGLGTVELEPWVLGEGDEWRGRLEDVYHHMGTARMSETPSRGVVDAQGRVHGIENLYLGGCATFPTGGHSNPTFTAIALGLRLADALKRDLA